MRIKKVLSQNRRDMVCKYACGHCGKEHRGPGYDDQHFHDNVVPGMNCKFCGKSGEPCPVEPRTPKYPPGAVL